MDGIGSTDTRQDSREALLRTITDLEARTNELETECARLRSASVAGRGTPAEHGGEGVDGRVDGAAAPVADIDGTVLGAVVTMQDVTARKRVEAALEESEAKYRTLFETIDEAFAVIELLSDGEGKVVDCRFVEVNQALERLTGLHDVVGKLGSEVVPNFEASWIDAYGQVARTGEPLRIENYNGDTDRWYLAYASRVVTSDGHQVAVLFDDVTERKRTEAALRESEEKYRTLFASIDQGFALCEMIPDESGRLTDFRYLEVNPAFEMLTGLPAATTVGSRVSEILSPPYDDWVDTYARVVQTQTPARFERYLVPLGRWLSVYCFPRGGLHFGVLFSDVTDTRRAELSLRQSNERFRIAEEASNGFIYDWDPQTDTVTRSEGFQRILGYGPGEVDETSSAWLDLIHQDDRSDLPVPTPEALAEGSNLFAGEYRVRARNGRYVWVLDRGLAIRDSAGTITRIVGSTVDITERKAVDEALRESEEKYRSLFESIDEGFAVLEVFPDERGYVTDVMYREANRAFERHSGIRDDFGERTSTPVPNLEQHWLDMLSRVYQTGEPTQTESYVADLGRWLNAQYARIGGVGSPFIAVVFNDVTERKLREQGQAFLLKLSDMLRAETGVEAVGNRAVHMIAEHWGVDRVYLVTLNPGDDNIMVTHEARHETMPPLRGSYRGSDFPAAIKEIFERTIVYNDVRTDTRLTDLDRLSFAGLGAVGFMAAPIRRGNETMTFAAGAVSTQPRSWTLTEVALFEDAVERTWAAVERARAEAALRASEENFRSIANVVPDLLWYGEPDGSRTWYNERWVEYTGQTLEQAIGWGWIHTVHPDDREESVRRYRESVELGTPLHREHRLRRHDGAYRWFLVRAQPSLDGSGRVIRMYGAATDVHETRTARDELERRVAERTSQLGGALEDVRSSEERLRLLLQQVPAMLWTTDRELRVMTLMGADVPVEGWPGNGRPVDELFADIDSAGTVTLHRRVLEGEPADFDFHIDRRTFEAHLEPLRGADGEIIGAIGVAYDVTDRTLRRLQEDFIASVSHELQTPLTSVRAGLGLLDAAVGNTLGPAERELLRASRRNAERLRLEIGQLLAANQLTTRGPRVERATINLHELVDGAVRSLQSLLQEKDQTIAVDMADRLEVKGDRRLLEQVLANLLSNAQRHTPPGTSISVSSWLVGQDVRLAVHDTGPGIPPDQLEAVFQRFYRSPGKRREGIGLGLAITRDAVEAQGGRVWAESVLGEGTTFFVSLPRAHGSDAS